MRLEWNKKTPDDAKFIRMAQNVTSVVKKNLSEWLKNSPERKEMSKEWYELWLGRRVMWPEWMWITQKYH